jgi:formamidopyrimidine-DNA glycosylase
MPELPEVQTTVDGIQALAKGLRIVGVWTDMYSKAPMFKDSIKNKTYFEHTFRPTIIGKKILSSKRRAKNILIALSGDATMLIHMKMTGHIMYGAYTYDPKKNSWTPKAGQPALDDPFNRFIHVVFSLDNGHHLVLSDMRKFAKVTLVTDAVRKELDALGVEPLDKAFDKKVFTNSVRRFPNAYIKTALMDQRLVVGIGNIYSDEILHASQTLPHRKVHDLNDQELGRIFTYIAPILRSGIDFGGDSMSDYRNIYGERGLFQGKHKAYRRTGLVCTRKGCSGIIKRLVLNTRSAHFCPTCQM